VVLEVSDIPLIERSGDSIDRDRSFGYQCAEQGQRAPRMIGGISIKMTPPLERSSMRGVRNSEGGTMSDDLLNRGQPDRSRINMHEDYEVKYWCKHLGVAREELQRLVDKVGSAASAVRKELGR
jgi:hypothetical protein